MPSLFCCLGILWVNQTQALTVMEYDGKLVLADAHRLSGCRLKGKNKMENLGEKLITIAILVYMLKETCSRLSAPPKDKEERKYFVIIPITNLLMKFCKCTDPRYIDKKDIGTVTLEGYWLSEIIIACYLVYFAVILVYPIYDFYYLVTALFVGFFFIVQAAFPTAYVRYKKRK